MKSSLFLELTPEQLRLIISASLNTRVTSHRLIDRDFMIVRYIPSRPMSGLELSQDDSERICRDIGAATAKLHNIKQARFGRVYDILHGGGFERWSDCIMDELDLWESVAVPTGILRSPAHELIRRLFAAYVYIREYNEPQSAEGELADAVRQIEMLRELLNC